MLTGKNLKVAVVLASAFEYINVGYDQGLMGGILSGKPFTRQFNNPSSTLQGAIASLYDVGSFIGSGVIAFLWGERMGRKWTIIIGEIILLIGALLQGTSYGIVQLCIGRVVAGLGNGMCSAAIPTWQAELTSHKSRGKALVTETGILILGVAVSFWVGYGTNFTNSSFQWRFPIFLQMIFQIGVLAAMPFLPETPRWLISQEREEEALKVIARLEDTEDLNDRVVRKKFNEIRDSYLKEVSLGDASIKNLFKKNDKQQNLRRMLLGMMPLMMNQVSGINAPSYYLPLLLEKSVGLERNLALILASCAATQYFFFSLLPIFYIDSFGRRKTIIWGSVGNTICMVVIAITNYVDTKRSGIATTFFFFLFFDCFGATVLPVSWCYSPEISSLQYRSRTNAMGMATQWIFNFVIVMITPLGVQNLHYKFYIIWACTNFSFIFMNYFFLVETAGHTLEEMDAIFEKNPGIFALNEDMTKIGSSFGQETDEEQAESVEEAGSSEEKIQAEHNENSAPEK